MDEGGDEWWVRGGELERMSVLYYRMNERLCDIPLSRIKLYKELSKNKCGSQRT